jgi:hypothetical protein
MPQTLYEERVIIETVKPVESRIETRESRESEEARNALNGAIGGTVIGLAFGIAVLGTIGFDGIPGLFEAILLTSCGALGGAMFGAIVGSTGIFAAKRH